MGKLIFQIIAATAGLWLAAKFISGVEFTGSLQTLGLAGTILGLINFFIKPILKLITLPLRLLTFGLFGLVINMVIIWLVVDVLFPGEFEIYGIIPLFWTTVIIWVVSFLLGNYTPKRKREVKE